jgi:hypothetical protein
MAEFGEDVRDPLTLEFRHAIRVGLAQVPRVPGPRNSTAQHPGRDLQEFCRDRNHDVLRFCVDTRIWPTNNISERDLRPTKTQQKISGRLTSEDIRATPPREPSQDQPRGRSTQHHTTD